MATKQSHKCIQEIHTQACKNEEYNIKSNKFNQIKKLPAVNLRLLVSARIRNNTENQNKPAKPQPYRLIADQVMSVFKTVLNKEF